MRRLGLAHPLLYGLLPVLAELNENVDAVATVVAIRPALLSLCLAAGLALLLNRRLKDPDRACALASIAMVLFFAHGSLLSLLGVPVAGPGRLATHAFVLVVFGLMLWAIDRVLRRRFGWRRPATEFLAISGGVAILLPVLGIFMHGIRLARPWPIPSDRLPLDGGEPPPNSASLPDIYYIVLDGYGREDVLRELYAIDNRPFLAWLEARGFYVAGESRSNYGQTSLSLASALNMTYLDFLGAELGIETRDQLPVDWLLQSSEVMRLVDVHGYLTVAFSTGYRRTELVTADHFLRAPLAGASTFESFLIETSVVSAAQDLVEALGLKLPHPGYASHRAQVRYTFSQLLTMPDLPGPKFVFAHIIIPHPPFIFSADGSPVTPDEPYRLQDGDEFLGTAQEYRDGYIAQLAYTNQQTQALLERILSDSPRPPVIILQADHGPGSRLDWDFPEQTDLRERMSILNAYYLPDGGQEALYPSISPVNTFRVVFNHYFGTDLPLLPDESFFSSWRRPYDFIEATP